MRLKELLRKDAAQVFLNPNEFGEKHRINGKEMMMVIDNKELLEREKRIKSYVEGVYNKQLLIYVRARDFGALPPVGKTLFLDQRRYIVTDSIQEGEMYSIHLEGEGS